MDSVNKLAKFLQKLTQLLLSELAVDVIFHFGALNPLHLNLVAFEVHLVKLWHLDVLLVQFLYDLCFLRY
jgi:hypothetical protein